MLISCHAAGVQQGISKGCARDTQPIAQVYPLLLLLTRREWLKNMSAFDGTRWYEPSNLLVQKTKNIYEQNSNCR